MGTAKNHQRIQHIVLAYQWKLAEIDEGLFLQTPPIGGWSYSEVYFHIFDSSILSLKEMIAATEGERKPTAFSVKMVLFFGQLPPGKKFKAPKRLAERLKKISKEESTGLITQFLEQLEKDLKIIKNADKNLKTLHPRLGYLNAFQWLRFIGIHLNHHLQQLHRIDQSYNR